MFYNLVSNVDDENKQGKMGILRNLIDNYESFFDPVPYKNNAKASIIYACVVFGNNFQPGIMYLGIFVCSECCWSIQNEE